MENSEQPQPINQVDHLQVGNEAEQAMRLIEEQSKKLESVSGLTLEKAREIILAIYGQGEILQSLNLPYYKGDIETANSHIIDAGPSASTVLTKLGSESNYLYALIKENIKGRVVVEIGPSNAWVESALYARKNGATAYVGIDIDKNSIMFPDLWKLENQQYQSGEPVSVEDLQGFAYPICDDPVNFLTKLEDHSVVTISSAVFSEPMDKDFDYRKKLQDLLNSKTLFGLHKDGPDFDPNIFLKSSYDPKRNRDDNRFKVAMFKGTN